ncbi:MAG: rhamnosyltransferase WsaF family glycosyltransferase [Solirubrobacterales bacterium]
MSPAKKHTGPVAVSMATYNPDPELFRVQVESIRAQTGCEWHCFISDDDSDADSVASIQSVIGDDERFTFSPAPGRLGFYRNFERAITLATDEYDLIALSDQDDRWYPDKLQTLVAGLGDAGLIYSDQRLVTEDSTVIAGTYWSTRKNNFTNIASLLIANTVTGAASMFRRSLAEHALPFPELPGEQYHDHWLGMVALALGDMAYVDRPLYDYVQHGGAVLGHEKANAGLSSRGIRRLDPRQWRTILGGWASAYFDVFLRLKAISQVVLERCGGEMPAKKRRTLERFAGSDRSLTGLLWLMFRPLRRLAGHDETLGMERVLVRAILYRHLAGVKRRLPRGLRNRLGSGDSPAVENGLTPQMRQKVAPLFPVVSKTQPTRVNLLIPTIDLEHLFGGYIAKFSLARRLAEAGVPLRIVTVDITPPLPNDWKAQVESYRQLDGLFDEVEIVFGRDGKEPLRMSPDDRFIATTWWTAHIATRLARQSNRVDGRFLYMIQEFEPLTVPPGTWSDLARASYDFPHDALFSTAILRDYFADEGLGVFRPKEVSAGVTGLTFRNAITPIAAPTTEELAERPKRKLVFYGRPEAHAARNLFQVGIDALRQAIGEGVFSDEWQFFGIGSTGSGERLDLGSGHTLELLPRADQEAYGEFLAGHDLGLALMDAPHPSLVPIEMASAGMLVVTTTWGQSKTGEKLEAISPNLISGPPDLPGVVSGLRLAAGQIDDFEARVAGAKVDWPNDWDEAFDDALLARINETISLP